MKSGAELEDSGRIWLRGALDEAALTDFDAAMPAGSDRKAGATLARALAPDAPLTRAISAQRPSAFATRAIAFDKSEADNWSLPWHQDRVIRVAARHDVPGFDHWTSKGGDWHCEPPIGVLAEMLFVRVHLDDAGAQAGAMEIALGSHRAGRVAEAELAEHVAGCRTEICQARRGDVLVMDMLLVHRSRRSTVAERRRVWRIDFATRPLPPPLEWGSLAG